MRNRILALLLAAFVCGVSWPEERPASGAPVSPERHPESHVGALRELLKAALAEPLLPFPHYELGHVYMRRGRNAEAAACFRRHLELDPRDADRRNYEVRHLFEKIEKEMETEPREEIEDSLVSAVELCLHWGGEIPEGDPEREKDIEQGLDRACSEAVERAMHGWLYYPDREKIRSSLVELIGFLGGTGYGLESLMEKPEVVKTYCDWETARLQREEMDYVDYTYERLCAKRARETSVVLEKHVPEVVRVESDGSFDFGYDKGLSADELKNLQSIERKSKKLLASVDMEFFWSSPTFYAVPGAEGRYLVSAAAPPKSERDFGKRLFLIEETGAGLRVANSTRGMADSYILRPAFFTGREKEKVLILAELGTEYTWGLLACEISDGELLELGSIDAAALDEEGYAVDPTPYCTAKRENDRWVVEFHANLALDPGGRGEREILRIGDAPIVFEFGGGEFTLKEGSYREQEPEAETPLSRLERETGDALARLDEAPDSKERQEEFLRVFERIYNYDSDETIALEVDGAFGKAHHRVHAYALAGNKTFLKALMAANFGPYGTGLAVVSERIHDEMLWENFENDVRLTLDALSELPPETRARLVKGVYTRPAHDGFDFAAILKKLREAEVPDGMRQDVEKIRGVVEPLAEMMARVEKVRDNFEKGKAAAALGPSGYEEAVRELQKVIAAVPEWPEPYDELGMIYLKQGRSAEAVASLKKYLELNPLVHPRILNQIRLLILKFEEETGAEP